MTRNFISKHVSIAVQKFPAVIKNEFSVKYFQFPDILWKNHNEFYKKMIAYKKDKSKENWFVINSSYKILTKSKLGNYSFLKPVSLEIQNKVSDNFIVYGLTLDNNSTNIKDKIILDPNEQKKFSISIQVREGISLQELHSYDTKVCMDSYALEILQNWIGKIDKLVYVEESFKYNKRFNLNNDICEWTVWIVKACEKPKLLKTKIKDKNGSKIP